MGRLGLTKSEFEKFLEEHTMHGFLDIKNVMSHLACADDPNHQLNMQQLEAFSKLTSKIPSYKKSLVNSSGIFLGPNYHFDLARPGAMIYGINPTPYKDSPVKPVVQIMGKVLQIRTLERDQSISYGALYNAKKGSIIATIGVGYADGYFRTLTNKSQCFFNGYFMDIKARVSMDSIMVDISHIPQGIVDKMDYVELIGPNIDIDKLAECANTIGYEILTSLGDRYNRVYI